MRNKLKQMITSVFAMTIMVAIFISCNKETETPATGLTHIKFETATKSTGFQRVDLFAFDEAGLFAGRWNCSESEISVKLKAGKYTLVAWGNLTENYTIKPQNLVHGQTVMSAVTISAPNNTNTIIAGSLTSAQVLEQTADQIFSITLEPAPADPGTEFGILGWGAINSGEVEM